MAQIVIAEFMNDALAADPARTRIDAALPDRCPRLEAIGRLGIGMEPIDLEACRGPSPA